MYAQTKNVREETLSRLDASLAVSAVGKLIDLLNCGNPRAEVAAARTILELVNMLIKNDLKARVNYLESVWKGALKRG